MLYWYFFCKMDMMYFDIKIFLLEDFNMVKEIPNWYGVAPACCTTVLSAIGRLEPILVFFDHSLNL